MAEQFIVWLEKNKEIITGPNYMLPKLQGFFQLISVKPGYNPDLHGYPKDAREPLTATLKKYAEHLMVRALN